LNIHFALAAGKNSAKKSREEFDGLLRGRKENGENGEKRKRTILMDPFFLPRTNDREFFDYQRNFDYI
jgi:hypothetical protein